jgi:capsular exopolysaccharide synthesis family protein
MNTKPWNQSSASRAAATTDGRPPLASRPARRAASADPAAFAVTPQLVLHTLNHWWKIALPAGLACAAVLAALVWLTFTPKYRATAWLLIHESPQPLFSGNSTAAASRNFVQTQLRLILSPMVMYGMDDVGPEGVVDQLLAGQLADWNRSHVPDLPQSQQGDRGFLADWLAREIRVTRDGQSDLYRVSFSSVDPTFARAVLNEVVRNYDAFQNNQKRQRSTHIIGLLEKTRRDRAEDLMLDERNLFELAGPVEVSAQPWVRERELYIQKLKWDLAQTELVVVDGADSPVVQDLRAQIEHEEQRLEAAKRIQADGPPDWQSLRLPDGNGAGFPGIRAPGRRYEDSLRQAGQGQPGNLQLELKAMELDRKRELVDRLAERVELLRIEQGAPDAVTVLRLPEEPTHPDERYPAKKLALAVSGGFALPFALFLLWELVARRVFNAERLEQDLELTIFGEIAQLPKRRRLVTDGADQGFDRSLQVFSDSFDTLSTNLAMSLDPQNVRVFAVASPVTGEGKTSVAAELARRLAENTHSKVLLIDADMRAPDIHRLFGIESAVGLADVLSGKMALEEAINARWNPQLHILPAGRPDGSPVALMGNGNLRSLLDQATEQYRFIVIDTPPILSAGESLVLTKAADVTLMCVMWKSSRTAHVRQAYKRLALTGITQVGLVLSGVPPQEYQRRYGSYGRSNPQQLKPTG